MGLCRPEEADLSRFPRDVKLGLSHAVVANSRDLLGVCGALRRRLRSRPLHFLEGALFRRDLPNLQIGDVYCEAAHSPCQPEMSDRYHRNEFDALPVAWLRSGLPAGRPEFAAVRPFEINLASEQCRVVPFLAHRWVVHGRDLFARQRPSLEESLGVLG